MNNPTLNELEYFNEVAKTKNISRASERLGITQPSLSLALQRLETSLGTPLFIRSKTGVQLTQAGVQLLSESKKFLSQWKSIRENILKASDELTGKYTLGCHPSVGLYCLHLFLPNILQKYQNINFDFSFDLSRKITEEVISFQLDFGIVINPTPHPDLVLKKITTDKVGFWQAAQKQKTNETLLCDTHLFQTQSLLKKIKSVHTFKRVMHVPNLEVILSLTAQGAGIGILPSRVAQNINSKNLSLELVNAKWPTYSDELYLIYRADTQKTKSSKILLNFIFESLSSAFSL